MKLTKSIFQEECSIISILCVQVLKLLTLIGLKLDYSKRTESILWLLMPCITRSSSPMVLTMREKKGLLSSARKDFNYPCHFSMGEWYRMHIYIFIFPKTNSSLKVLSILPTYELVMDVVTVLFLDSLLLWVTSLSPTRGTHGMLHYRDIDSCANFPGQTLQRPSNCCCWPTRYCFLCIQ